MDALQFTLSRIGKVETHPHIVYIYRYDFSLIPRILSGFVKNPICIVFPKSIEDVLRILEIAERYETPVVPRGAATSAYGGCIPLKRCIVVDFKLMSNFSFYDNAAIVESGAIWMDIEREAKKIGKALRVYPTSANVSTVGGWIAQGGYGVGSLKYGGIIENIDWIEVADFGGVRRVEGDGLKYYVGCFGTTGLIVRACIKLREDLPIFCKTLECDFGEAMAKVEGYHAVFKDERLMAFEGFEAKNTLLLCSENGKDCTNLGKKMWEKRLMPLKAVSAGKHIFSEVVVPKEKAELFYLEAKKISEGIEAVFSREEIVFIGYFGGGYRNMLRTLKFVKVAEKFDGRVYATGMLFPHKFNKDLRDYKKRVDPKNLLNPGKSTANVFSRILRVAEKFL
ncbi:MAG: FAD-binding oxidoreductase [Archaeoglobaceae archaeon]